MRLLLRKISFSFSNLFLTRITLPAICEWFFFVWLFIFSRWQSSLQLKFVYGPNCHINLTLSHYRIFNIIKKKNLYIKVARKILSKSHSLLFIDFIVFIIIIKILQIESLKLEQKKLMKSLTYQFKVVQRDVT